MPTYTPLLQAYINSLEAAQDDFNSRLASSTLKLGELMMYTPHSIEIQPYRSQEDSAYSGWPVAAKDRLHVVVGRGPSTTATVLVYEASNPEGLPIYQYPYPYGVYGDTGGYGFSVYGVYLMKSAFGPLQPTYIKKDLSQFFTDFVHGEHDPGSAVNDWVFDGEYSYQLQAYKSRKELVDYAFSVVDEGLSEQDRWRIVYENEVFTSSTYLQAHGVPIATILNDFIASRVWASMPNAEELPNSGFGPIPKDIMQLLSTIGNHFIGAGDPYYLNPVVSQLGGGLAEDFSPFTVVANGVADIWQQGVLAKRTRGRDFAGAFTLTIRHGDRYFAGLDPIAIDEYRLMLPEVYRWGVWNVNLGDSLTVAGDPIAPTIAGYNWGLAVNGGAFYVTPECAVHEVRMRTAAFTFDSQEGNVYRPVLVNIGPAVTTFADAAACQAAYVEAVENMGAIDSNGLWYRLDGLPVPLTDDSKFMVVTWPENRGACCSLNGQANEGILWTLQAVLGIYAKLPDYSHSLGGGAIEAGIRTFNPYYVSEFYVTTEQAEEYSTSVTVGEETTVTKYLRFDLVVHQRCTVPPLGMANTEFHKLNPDTLVSLYHGATSAIRYVVNLSDFMQVESATDVTTTYSVGGLTKQQIMDNLFTAAAAIVNPTYEEVSLQEILALLGLGGGGGGGGGEEDP